MKATKFCKGILAFIMWCATPFVPPLAAHYLFTAGPDGMRIEGGLGSCLMGCGIIIALAGVIAIFACVALVATIGFLDD